MRKVPVLALLRYPEWFPVGAHVISGDLRDIGLDSTVYDVTRCGDVNEEQIGGDLVLLSIQPGMLSKKEFEPLCAKLKQAGKKMFVGGAHVTPEFIEKIAIPNEIDYCFIGDGDRVVATLVQSILDGDGVEHKSLYVKGETTNIHSLKFNTVLMKDRRILEPSETTLNKYTHYALEISRGCPKQLTDPCMFCSWPKSWRVRNHDDIRAEARNLLYGQNKHVHLTNSNYNHEILMEIIETYPNSKFEVVVENDEWGAFREWIVEKNIKNVVMSAGIESFVPEKLVILNKRDPYNAKKRFDIIREAKELGIQTDTNVLIGVPNETHEMMMKEYDALMTLKQMGVTNYEIRPVYREYYSPWNNQLGMQTYLDLAYFRQPYNNPILKKYNKLLKLEKDMSQSRNQNVEITAIQFELWEECNNNCQFCYLKKGRLGSDATKKIENITKVLDIISDPNNLVGYNAIGLIGGEFFQGQIAHPDVKAAFFQLIDKIDELMVDAKILECWITASLMTEDLTDLFGTLERFNTHKFNTDQRVLLATSYDTIGRFRDVEHKELWLNNLNEIHTRYPYFQLHTQVITTQSFIDEILDGGWFTFKTLDELSSVDYKLPGVFRADYADERFHDEKEYVKLLRERVSEFPEGFFIEDRAKFLEFMRRQMEFYGVNKLKHFCDNKIRSKTLYFMNSGDCVMDRWDENNKAENASCGHPYDSFAYLDSDNCARCDVANLIEVLDEM